MFVAGLRASYTLFKSAWHAVLRADVSWHDKTPVRGNSFIRDKLKVSERQDHQPFVERYGSTQNSTMMLIRDIEAMDDRLAGSWEQFLSYVARFERSIDKRTALAVFGTFSLVLYVYPYLGLAFIPLTFFYVSYTCGCQAEDSTCAVRFTARHRARSSGSTRYLGASSTALSGNR
jgi:ATP-binding cassette subfamily C (CFTR/MRP) protein 1